MPQQAPPYGTLVRVGQRLLVFADSDENGERPDFLYEPATGRWQELADDPLSEVYDRWSVVDGGRLLVFGSSMGPDQEAKLAAAYDLATGDWTRLPDSPGGGYQVWRSGDEAWLNPHFGSAGGGVLDLGSDIWAAFPDPPPGLGDDALDLAGIIGPDGATYEYAEGLIRDTQHERWLRIPPRPHPTSEGHGVTALGDALVIFGGQRWDGSGGELVAETWIWRP